jgi:hypothetical protein
MTKDSKIIGGVAYATKPNGNTGLPWSAEAIRELKHDVEHGQSIAEIANFLCRSEAEVQIEALGLESGSSQ